MGQIMKRIGILLLLCGLMLPANKVQAEQMGVDIVAKVEKTDFLAVGCCFLRGGERRNSTEFIWIQQKQKKTGMFQN